MSSSESQSDSSGGSENESQSGETTNTTGGVDPERGEGKGSGPDDDDDPADGFEDDADSQQLSDAQATVSEFIDDGESGVGSNDEQTPVGGVESDIEGVDSDTVSSESDDLKTLDDINVAESPQLAGGIPAAIDDDRDDFHDIRNGIINADGILEAEDMFEEKLDAEEIDAAVEEIQIQQEIRREYDEIDDIAELDIGQEVLYDADRPKRGVVEDLDADGTVWIDNEHRDAGGGVNPEYGNIYADPDHESSGDSDFETYDQGRYGLASNSEVLENAFSAADETQNARDAGVTDGNTTGDYMKVLTMDDGSEVYATPVDAYPTKVVSSRDKAIDNNLRSPKIVQALGGNACNTELTEGPTGTDHIAKEGIGGDLVKNTPQDRVSVESAENTMAAAYFVGNSDLHGANMKVTDGGELTIIDHDSAGYTTRGMMNMGSGTKVAEISNFGAASPGVPMGAEPREKIYDKAIQIKSGEKDLPVDEGTQHHQYAQDAADKAVRAAVADSSYDVPDDVTPSELKTTPDGHESFSDFSEGDAVVAVDRNGNKVDGEIINVETDADSKPGLATQNHVKVDKVDETGDFDLKSTESLKRVIEVL